MNVNTIEQYKILEYINDNFYIEKLEIRLIDRATIEIKDKNDDTMQLKYLNGKIVY